MKKAANISSGKVEKSGQSGNGEKEESNTMGNYRALKERYETKK